jgi:RNA polymerase sigma factor (sigma-70 family)
VSDSDGAAAALGPPPMPFGERTVQQVRATFRDAGPLRSVMRPREAPALEREEQAVASRALTVAQRTAYGVLGDREAARDVAQEVAVVAIRRHGALRDRRALDAWLHRIAVRAALREAHRSRRRRAAEQARAAERPPANGDDLRSLLGLLEGLPSRQRAALTLRYAHDLTDDEIAHALGCRAGTVRSLLSRGREALRRRIERESR